MSQLSIGPHMFIELCFCGENVSECLDSSGEFFMDRDFDSVLDTGFKKVKSLGIDVFAGHDKLGKLEQTYR